MQVRSISYATWKAVVQNNSWSTYHQYTSSESVMAWAGNIDIVFAVHAVNGDFTDWDTNFSSSSTEVGSENDAVACIVGLSATHLVERTSDGRHRVAVEKGDATKKTIYSHDWADRTTWYQQSVRVVDEVATDSGDHTTYNLANDYVIDLYHGKIAQEDFVVDGESNSYRVVVKVDDVEVDEVDPCHGTGDYTVNYVNGDIVFEEALVGTETVKVTYYYSPDTDGRSTFVVRPLTGKKLMIEVVEVQFPADLVVNDTMRYQVYGYVDVFAPQYTPDPYPSLTLIPIGNPLVFKTMNDYFSDANGSWVSYPAIGGEGWRGASQSTYILQWNYIRSTVLHSAYGMELRMILDHDDPMGGETVGATFYAASVDEE